MGSILEKRAKRESVQHAGLQGGQNLAGESAQRRLTGQSQPVIRSLKHEANAVRVEHWELLVELLLYAGPTQKLLDTIASSSAAPGLESKRVSTPGGRSVGVLAETELSGNKDRDLFDQSEGREETDGRISAGGTGNGTEPYGKERRPRSVGPSASIEEDLLFHFVGPHAGERLSNGRDRIAKQLHLSYDPKAKQVLAPLFVKPSETDSHLSKGRPARTGEVTLGNRAVQQKICQVTLVSMPPGA